MASRVEKILKEMKKSNLDSVLVTSKANFYYISNYYTEPHERVIAAFISTKMDPVILLPAMEVEDAKTAGWAYPIISYYDHENPWQLLLNYFKKNESIPQSIAIEQDHITLERFQSIQEILPKTEIFNAKEMLAKSRVIKSDNEHNRLKEAAELADFGIETGVNAIQEGISEMELIATIEYELKKQGVQGMSFSTMALSGSKTASPHGTPSSKKITAGDLVLFDLGVIHEGYCSDITRTVAYKSVTNEQKKIYQTVLEAEQKAIETSKLGTEVGKLDKIARDIITNAGYGEYFTHRIGHGLGIETHEYPSMHSNNTLQVQAGMCFTIEPGIYIPNIGGVRIEDMVFMKETGPTLLTNYPKELQIID
ncbi:M24 family metallopeptidase [Oceanobacillus halophilus]|uniref:Aminopeptidase P family protein n=1 Tax=Oceanobacillus halophilus TaxID=930130 RepID=A0A494ZUA4_9BACI|nr:Xaa-Pro peptidase family protein [Oceanobacillus halophilus]RKQ29877.1 aminopeptidase P family protein [Oceanobacillus halophilus]